MAPRFLWPILIIILLLLSGCAQDSGSEFNLQRSWHSETEEIDGVTVIRTLNGSIWRGMATLEEELTLGVAEGDTSYMFVAIAGAAQVNNRLFVLDVRPPVLRMYDSNGEYLATIAGEGDGPGEFRHPRGIEVHPIDRRLYITDANSNRVNVYSTQGEILNMYRIKGWPGAPNEIVDASGTIYIYTRIFGQGIEPYSIFKFVGYGPVGVTGDTLDVPESTYDSPGLNARRPNGAIAAAWSIPFMPEFEWTITPSLAIVSGISSDYSFTIQHYDGQVTRVERAWTPIPVLAGETAWYRDALHSFFHHFQQDWQWDGPRIPKTKPAYVSLFSDLNGRIWVIRPGAGVELEGAGSDQTDWQRLFRTPAWSENRRLDVFEESGRYLGEVQIPEGYILNHNFWIVFVDMDLILAVVKDSEGVDYLKKYRLLLPGERE